MACHQLSSCNKWTFAINMEKEQPINRRKTFLQGRKTCLNSDPCRAQADHKILQIPATNSLLLSHYWCVTRRLLGLSCVMRLGSSANAGSCFSFTHQPLAAALSFSNISHVQPCFCSTLLYSWRGWGRERSSTGRFSL